MYQLDGLIVDVGYRDTDKAVLCADTFRIGRIVNVIQLVMCRECIMLKHTHTHTHTHTLTSLSLSLSLFPPLSLYQMCCCYPWYDELAFNSAAIATPSVVLTALLVLACLAALILA